MPPESQPRQPTAEADPRLRIQVVDVSDSVQANAVDRAEEYINERTNQRGLRSLWRKIWHGNIARDYYRQREIRRGRQEITETGNLYALDQGTHADHERAMGAVVRRFTSEYDEMTHDGETNQELSATPHGQQFMTNVRALVNSYASGAIDHDQLQAGREHLLAQLGENVNADNRQRGLMYADNILEVAQQARSAFEHGLATERIDAALSGYLGEARTGVRSQVRREATDRALDFLHRHHVTMANEATIGAAVGIAVGIAKFTVKKGITALGAAAGLGIGAGVIAGAREHLRVGQERQLHLRQRAEGQEMPANAPRRAELEATRYETVSAQELTERLQSALNNLDANNLDSVRGLADRLAEIEARINSSDSLNADFISFSSKVNVEEERFNLDLRVAEGRAALRQALESNPEFAGLNLEDLLRASLDRQENSLLGDVDQKDRAFRTLRWHRSRRMFAIGLIAGESLGLVAQELHALADSGLRGVFEGPGGDRHTLLAGLRGGSDQHREFFDGGLHMKDVANDLPKGWHMVHVPGPESHWTLVDNKGNVILDRMQWDSQGNLATGQRHWLIHGLGLKLNQHHLRYFDDSGPGKYGGRAHPAWVDHYVTSIGDKSTPYEFPTVLPIYSRLGLERLPGPVRNPNMNGMYYGGQSLEQLRSWINADPSRLRTRRKIKGPDGQTMWVEADGTPVKRDVDRERGILQTYLDKERAKNGEYYKLVEKVADAMAPMSDKCRVAVNVPAWMEAKNLRTFLDEYTKQVDTKGQPIDIKAYEINIMVNRRTGTEPDESVDVIKQFITDFEAEHGFKPAVNYYDAEFDPPNNNVGYARKLLTDAVILRSLRRAAQSEALYIESEDADMVRIDPRTVYNLIQKFDANPYLDALRGTQDRAPEFLMQNDYLFLRQRMKDFWEVFARNQRYRDPRNPSWNFTWNRTVTGGWNTGYTAEAYGLIEGYESMESGEDLMVGERISMVRGDAEYPNLDVVGTVATRNDSSPRGFIQEIITGKGRYEDFGDEEYNMAMRSRSVEDALAAISRYDRITPENQDTFGAYIKEISSWSKDVTPSPAEAAQLTRRLMFWLGFKRDDYTLGADNEIEIHNWDNIKASLDNYRARHGGDISPATPRELSVSERIARMRAALGPRLAGART